ncbi:hypothetical protein UCRNP2_9497 [Neofusicoccum parvum UCRNP2]|uniref:Bzip transcription factor protein n=2 Tax=Neofusicoccum parvum TaxID=310453 RepID=R1G6Q0_BOTPV|nr:hypothetical protein UCRNP2_9497 [Neofusicoccum parvum UCRNP2]GME48675.1 hypothetical protein GTA08_BOTSDO13505 [Neofusicoccum parvum]
MADPNTKDNLARIRDNQRRSRARRKEYLSELESKYRSCEQMGVQASAEIQAAAKRVLDENRRLRALLHQKGVCDAEIDSFTHANPLAPSSAPAETLDTMLKTRRPCNPQSACGSTGGCSSSKSPVQDAPAAMPPLATKRELGAQIARPQLPPQPYVGTASMNSALSPPATVASPMGMATPVQSLAEASSAIPASAYDPAYASFYGIPMQTSWGYPNVNNMHMNLAPQSPNSSSCVHAANIIRGMRTDVGPELEQDLGCSSPGQECKVNNNVVFELVDKYSMQGL